MPYIGTSPSNGVRRKHTYTATASQTSFSGAGAEGATLSYNDSNFVDVYQNGVKLSEADYTSTSGTAIVLAQGASVSDIVEIVVYDVFSVADTVSKSAGGTFDGAVDMASTLQVDGAITSSDGMVITTADNTDTLSLISTDADASSGPNLNIFRNSSSPADNDFLGNVKFNGRNDNSQDVQYSEIEVYATDVSDGTEDGLYNVNVMTGGSNETYLQMSGGNGVVFNEDSKDIDFRVESDTKSHAFFMEGSNGRIVINAADATGQSSHMTLLFESASYSAFAGRMTDNGSGAGFLVCRKSDGSTIGQVARNGTSDAVQFLTSSDYRLKENVSYNFDATAKLKQLKPCTFTWINDESNTTYQGFLAHEVQDIVPHAVNGAKDAVDADGNIEAQSIDKSDIVPLLVKTIQELEARITALENGE